MGSGGLRGLQIPRSDVQSVRGGFDSHTFPPFVARIARGALIALVTLVAAGAPRAHAAAAAHDGAEARTPAFDRDDAAPPALARSPAPPDSARAIEVVSDSTATLTRGGRGRRAGGAESDSARLSMPLRWSDQPRMVMLRSLVLPGWGQLYNRAYFKAGLVVTG